MQLGSWCCDEVICHIPTVWPASIYPHKYFLRVGLLWLTYSPQPSTRMETVCRQVKVISCNIPAIEDWTFCHGRLGDHPLALHLQLS